MDLKSLYHKAIQILCRRANGNAIADNYSDTNGRVNAAVADSLGFYVSSRTAIDSVKLWRNASQVGTTNTSTESTSNITGLNRNMYLWAANDSGGITNYSSRELAWMHIGAGLSDAEVSTLNSIVTTYQTTLSRNV